MLDEQLSKQTLKLQGCCFELYLLLVAKQGVLRAIKLCAALKGFFLSCFGLKYGYGVAVI